MMSDTIIWIDLGDGITEGTTIWRYMSVGRLRRMVKTGDLYLPNAYEFEDTDVNEGRITNNYLNTMRQAFRLDHSEYLGKHSDRREIEREAEDDLRAACARLRAMRRWCFISCWTFRENENAKMWKVFGDDGKGVVLKSTVGLVGEQIERARQAHLGDDSLLISNKISYDRQVCHLRITGNPGTDSLIPLWA